MALTNYLENKLLDHAIGKTAFAIPTVYIALFKTAPDDTGAGSECAYTGYARQAVGGNFAAASGGSSANSADFTFGLKTAGTDDTVGWWATFDANAAGNMLEYGTFDASKLISNGDNPKILSGQLTRTAD